MRRSARRGNLQAAGISSIHHVGPQLFGGATLDHGKGVRLASPEKALVDFLYLSPAPSRLFALLPELELPSWVQPPRGAALGRAHPHGACADHRLARA